MNVNGKCARLLQCCEVTTDGHFAFHLATVNTRSIHSRGGLMISLGNSAKESGGMIRSPESNRSGSREFSSYIRSVDATLPENQ